MTIDKPTVVYLEPDDHLPPGRPPYVLIECHPDGAVMAIGHGPGREGSEEIFSEQYENLDAAIEGACNWASTHQVDVVHVRRKVKGWEYAS